MSFSADWSCELGSMWKSWGPSLWPCKEFHKYSYCLFFDQLFLAKMCLCSVQGACNIVLSLFSLCFNWGGDGLVWTECEELKENEILTPRAERLLFFVLFLNEGSVSKPVQLYQWNRLKTHAEGLLHSSNASMDADLIDLCQITEVWSFSVVSIPLI